MSKEIAITAYKCKKCGKLHYPFHDRCLECKGREFEKVKPQGNAKLLTYTAIFISQRPDNDRGMVLEVFGIGNVSVDDGVSHQRFVIESAVITVAFNICFGHKPDAPFIT